MACEALKMVCAAKCSDELSSKMVATFAACALLFDCTWFPISPRSLCQLLLAARLPWPVCTLLLVRSRHRCISTLMPPVHSTVSYGLKRLSFLNRAIGVARWPFLRWETHPKGLVGLPAQYEFPCYAGLTPPAHNRARRRRCN